MLNQQSPSLNSIDSYIEPLLKRVLQEDKLVCFGLVKIDSISSSCDKGKGDRFKLSIPYAGKHLVWHVMFDSQYPELGPDFVFNDDNCLAKLDIDRLINYVPTLVSWNPNNVDGLLSVLTELLFYYKQHQIMILSYQADRLHFEYCTLVGDGKMCPEDVEVLLLPYGSKPTEARFLIRIALDLSALPSQNNSIQNDAAILIVVFHGPDWNRIVPQLYLSKRLEETFGGSASLHVPPFPPDKCFMDYVPEIKKLITEKINCIAQCFEKKKNFIAALLMLQRGSVVEYDAIDFTSITVLLVHRDFHFLIHFHLSSAFPKKEPSITLQSIYHMTAQGKLYSESVENFPYSPRWEPQDMINKLFTYITEEVISKFQANSVKNNRSY